MFTLKPNSLARQLFRGTLLAAALQVPLHAQQTTVPMLQYDAQTRGPVPVPPSERSLQTVVAEPWFQVSKSEMVLEGPSFDRDGDLLFSDVSEGKVLRISAQKQLTTIVSQPGLGPGGLAIHRDGRIFIAGIADLKGVGSVVAVNADGSNPQTIVSVSAGYLPNDLVFDSNGGFCFSDFRGSATDLSGGVYYVSPDFRTITPVLQHIAEANGIALSPDGKRLWCTEFGRNALYRVDLEAPTKIALLGTSVLYFFNGAAPDSARVDGDGNVYVAMYSQGRVLVFNRNGIPIGQVLLPGRELGHNLLSTSMALKPGTNELYIVTNDGSAGQGATIFRARAFANAPRLYAQQ